MAAGKSMTPLLEKATSAIDLKWIEVTVLAGVDFPPPPTSPPLPFISQGLWETSAR